MSRARNLRIALGTGAVGIAAIVGVLLVHNGDASADDVADNQVKAADSAQLDHASVERGRGVAIAADCAACHTRPGGGKVYAGGYALQTPFGAITSSNITPDRDTGIGNWTERDFFRAVRHGRSPQHLLYPAMPYTSYVQMSDADMHDLWSYVRSVPAINTPSGGTDLGFPYNIRTMMLGWNLLFFNNKPYTPDTSQSAAWNRGHYLVDTLGHCGACHTAKNMLGGDKTYLAGGTLQGWYAPPLDKGTVHGLGSWSQQDLVGYLKNGSNAHAVAIGPMAEEVEHSSQHMPVDDLQAIATYLESLPGHDDDAATPLASDDAQMQRGAHIYVTACSACHTPGGEGIPGMATHLADNPAIRAQDPSSLIHVLMTGAKAAVTGTNPTGAGMPSFAWKLNDADAAAVLTYVRNSWGNAAPAVRARDVAKAREALKAREAM